MLILILIIVLITNGFTLLLLQGAMRKHRLVPIYKGRYPSVTVIRPVKGLDVGAAENFRAALNTGYPATVETLFVFDCESDPAYKVACDVVREHRDLSGKNKAAILISGVPPSGRTGKLHAMIVGERAATSELIAFSDSDTRPDKDVLRILVESLLSTPGAGSAFVPVVSDQPILKAGDLFYALLQNSLYAPWALLASGSNRELPFIMGQFMVFTRDCLKAIGGVVCASGQLVDDMYIGKCVHEAKFLNVIAPHSLSIHSTGLTLKKFIPIFRKWFQFGKNGLPYSFLWRQWVFAAQFFVPLIVLTIAVFQNRWWAAGFALFVLAAYSRLLCVINKMYGGSAVPLKLWWGPAAMMLMSPVIVLSNRINNTVQWRGREYKVDKHAALRPSDT